ncbi:heavy-metal-associated domain-containing protein [Verrucomicrobia bacterium]|nr:heavy-metal-associated domain-containing protein [Verrucomicrobiota bacterium]
MQRRSFLTLALIFACLPMFLMAAPEIAKEISEDARIDAAKAQLSAEPGTVSLYAKGLCCESCAIGIRKKVAKLKFVDRKRFNKGIDLDAKTQLVQIAIKAEMTHDVSILSQAIEDAGYEPVNLYALKDGSLETTSLVKASK